MKPDRPYWNVVIIIIVALGLAVAFIATAQQPNRFDPNDLPTEGG